MSYQVLARKWRPKNFREMIGQEHVLRALINALDHERLHHAYLFTGTRGVGKTTIARILARCFNCELGISSEPCGECSACAEIGEGRSVDLIEVDAASRTKVEDTRELLDNVQYAPTRNRFKIYLIDEVHMLSNHSFNALLKTLEEPPEHVKFLLATTDPQKLPVTILSRCLQFNLKNMSPQRIVTHLQNVLAQEVVPFDEPALWLLARAADGSMRDGLSLTDQAIAFGNGNVAESDVAAMLGTINPRLIENIVEGLIAEDAKAILELVASFSEHAPDYSAALADLLDMFHRIAVAQAAPDTLDNSLGDRDRILHFAENIPAEDVQLYYQTALVGRRDLAFAASSRSGFEMALLRMLAFKPQGVTELPSRTLKGAGKPSAGSKSQQNTRPATEVAGGVKKPITEVSNASEGLSETPSTASTAKKPVSLSDDKQVVVNGAGSKVDDAGAPNRDSPKPSSDILRQRIKDISGSEGFVNKGSSIPKTSEPLSPKENLQDASKKVSLDQLNAQTWFKVYKQLGIKGILQSTASNCVLLGREHNFISMAMDDSKGTLFDPSHVDRLQGLLSDYFGESLKLEINLVQLDDSVETPSQAIEREKQQRYDEVVEDLHADPVIQTLQREFGASIVEDSINCEQKNSDK